MNLTQLKSEKEKIPIIIHECYKYGHIWRIIEQGNYYISVCRICGKIGDRKLK